MFYDLGREDFVFPIFSMKTPKTGIVLGPGGNDSGEEEFPHHSPPQ